MKLVERSRFRNLEQTLKQVKRSSLAATKNNKNKTPHKTRMSKKFNPIETYAMFSNRSMSM